MYLNRKSLAVFALIATLLVSGTLVASAAESAVVDAADSFLHDINENGYYTISPEEVNTQRMVRPNLFILDVRTSSEVEEGKIPGAVHIQLNQHAQSLDQLPENKDATIYVYCKAGTRGAYAVAALHMLGWTDAYNMSGGILAWNDAGFPTE